MGVLDLGTGVPTGRMTNPLEQGSALFFVTLENQCNGTAEQQVGKAYDALDRWHVAALLGASSQFGDVDRLTDRPHRLVSVFEILRAALDENGAFDSVAIKRIGRCLGHSTAHSTKGISRQLLQFVAAGGMFPEMVVRIADHALGLEHLLPDLIQPDAALLIGFEIRFRRLWLVRFCCHGSRLLSGTLTGSLPRTESRVGG